MLTVIDTVTGILVLCDLISKAIFLHYTIHINMKKVIELPPGKSHSPHQFCLKENKDSSFPRFFFSPISHIATDTIPQSRRNRKRGNCRLQLPDPAVSNSLLKVTCQLLLEWQCITECPGSSSPCKAACLKSQSPMT